MSVKFSFKPYDRNFIRPLLTAKGKWVVRKGFILRVETAEGVGYGEVAPIPEFGSETITQAEFYLRSLVTEQRAEPNTNFPSCAFALSAAHRSINEKNLKKKNYAVSALLPAGSSALAVVKKKLEKGYKNFKWKIGLEPLAKELELARALFDCLSPGVVLRLDANASLDIAKSEAWLELLSQVPQQVDFLEQPLPCGQESLMADLMDRFGISIALDESLNFADGARWLIRGAWAGPLIIKAPIMGDVIFLCRRLEAVADQVVLSSVFETGIGMENALAMADFLPKMKRPVGFDTINAFDRTMSQIVPSPIISVTQRLNNNLKQIWDLI